MWFQNDGFLMESVMYLPFPPKILFQRKASNIPYFNVYMNGRENKDIIFQQCPQMGKVLANCTTRTLEDSYKIEK